MAPCHRGEWGGGGACAHPCTALGWSEYLRILAYLDMCWFVKWNPIGSTQQANVESGYHVHIVINFSAHCLLGACCLLDKICLQPQQDSTALIKRKLEVCKAQVDKLEQACEGNANKDHFCK